MQKSTSPKKSHQFKTTQHIEPFINSLPRHNYMKKIYYSLVVIAVLLGLIIVIPGLQEEGFAPIATIIFGFAIFFFAIIFLGLGLSQSKISNIKNSENNNIKEKRFLIKKINPIITIGLGIIMLYFPWNYEPKGELVGIWVYCYFIIKSLFVFGIALLTIGLIDLGKRGISKK